MIIIPACYEATESDVLGRTIELQYTDADGGMVILRSFNGVDRLSRGVVIQEEELRLGIKGAFEKALAHVQKVNDPMWVVLAAAERVAKRCSDSNADVVAGAHLDCVRDCVVCNIRYVPKELTLGFTIYRYDLRHWTHDRVASEVNRRMSAVVSDLREQYKIEIAFDDQGSS